MSRTPVSIVGSACVTALGAIGAVLAASSAVLACGAPAQRPSAAAPCPSVAPSAASSASSSLSPVASATPAQGVSPADDKPLPAPAPQRTRWSDTFAGGEVLLRAHPAGIAVIPQFLATEVEGATMAVLDRAGVAKWERRLGAVGAVGAAVLPDGAIAALVADPLDWPKTAEPYEFRRVIVVSADGKSERAFRLPSGASGASIELDASGHLLVAGSHASRIAFGKGLELDATKDEPKGFVAALDRDGRAVWARALPAGTLVRAVSPDRLLLASDPDLDGPQTLAVVDANGKDVFRLPLSATCKIRSLAPRGAAVGVITSPECFGTKAAADDPAQTCYHHRLDGSTGKLLATVKLPDCLVAVDDSGFAAVTEERSLIVLDASGKEVSSMSLPIPQGCLYMGYRSTGVLFDGDAVHVAGSCQGERIGTMMNSYYSRAYARATTYLSSHDAR